MPRRRLVISQSCSAGDPSVVCPPDTTGEPYLLERCCFCGMPLPDLSLAPADGEGGE